MNAAGAMLLVAVIDAGLTPLQREVFIDRNMIGRSLREIAADMGVSKQAVSRADRRAAVKLSRSLFVASLQAAA